MIPIDNVTIYIHGSTNSVKHNPESNVMSTPDFELQPNLKSWLTNWLSCVKIITNRSLRTNTNTRGEAGNIINQGKT